MVYFSSGVSTALPQNLYGAGVLNQGQDFAQLIVNSTGQLFTTAGVAQEVLTSIVNHTFSGNATYLLSSKTPERVQIYNNNAYTGNTITVSGTPAGTYTFNGSNSSTITSAYGTKTYYNISGSGTNYIVI